MPVSAFLSEVQEKDRKGLEVALLLQRIQNFVNTRSHELVRSAVVHAKKSPAQYGAAVMTNVPLATSMANLVLSLQLRQAQVMYDEWQGARRSLKDFEVRFHTLSVSLFLHVHAEGLPIVRTEDV